MRRATVWSGWLLAAANGGTAVVVLVLLLREVSDPVLGLMEAGWVGGPFVALGVLAGRGRRWLPAVLLIAAATVGAGWIAVAVICPDLFGHRDPTSGIATLMVPVVLWAVALLTWAAVAAGWLVRRRLNQGGLVEPGR